MYRVDVIYDDESVYSLDGFGEFTVIGVVKDILKGAYTSEDPSVDVVGIHISVADPSGEE